jgi:hypothetical protein
LIVVYGIQVTTILIHATAPVPAEDLVAALGARGLALSSRLASDFFVTAATDAPTLASSVADALESLAGLQAGSVVPERVSMLEFNLRPAAG